jgi:hypothetical protein
VLILESVLLLQCIPVKGTPDKSFFRLRAQVFFVPNKSNLLLFDRIKAHSGYSHNFSWSRGCDYIRNALVPCNFLRNYLFRPYAWNALFPILESVSPTRILGDGRGRGGDFIFVFLRDNRRMSPPFNAAPER